MSPKPSMEKCPIFWFEGNTNFPGNDSLGGWCICSLLAMALIGLFADLVATLTITLALKTYLEKKTQKTSYNKSPDNSKVDTLRLGNLTKAMKATQRPIPMTSMRNQWPVMIQIKTIKTETAKLAISAIENRPQNPKDTFLWRPQGL